MQFFIFIAVTIFHSTCETLKVRTLFYRHPKLSILLAVTDCSDQWRASCCALLCR